MSPVGRVWTSAVGDPSAGSPMVKRHSLAALVPSVDEGFQNEQRATSFCEMPEPQKQGMEGRDRFLNQMERVKNERKFAEVVDSREDLKTSMKLPASCKFLTLDIYSEQFGWRPSGTEKLLSPPRRGAL